MSRQAETSSIILKRSILYIREMTKTSLVKSFWYLIQPAHSSQPNVKAGCPHLGYIAGMITNYIIMQLEFTFRKSNVAIVILIIHSFIKQNVSIPPSFLTTIRHPNKKRHIIQTCMYPTCIYRAKKQFAGAGCTKVRQSYPKDK